MGGAELENCNRQVEPGCLRGDVQNQTRTSIFMQDINLHLCKRHNDMKEHLGHLKSAVTLMDTELRDIT